MRNLKGGLLVIGLIFFSFSNSYAASSGNPVDLNLSPAQNLYDKAMAALKNNDLLLSRQLLTQILVDYPDFPAIEAVSRELEDLNVKVIRSNNNTPQTTSYSVQKGDTLGRIAQKFSTTIELIKLRNGLVSDHIKAGQKLTVWTGQFRIVVNKSHNTLTLLDESGIVKIYPVSTGKEETVTPAGEFFIKDRIQNPVWFHRGEVIPPGTPKNFLGTRWLGFNLPKYGIHGTVEPQLIGKSVSGGCIRMKNQDVEELYLLIPEGTKVIVQE